MSAPVIPGFAFVEHLGSGGFADVFLYEQQWPRQRVAVKVVRPDVPLTDREKYLFTAEANAMARLADHPYIVSVITAGVTQGDERPYLVMRYCPPPDLGVRVRSNPMPVMDAVSTGIIAATIIRGRATIIIIAITMCRASMSRVITTTTVVITTTIAGGDRSDRSTETGSLRRACFLVNARGDVPIQI